MPCLTKKLVPAETENFWASQDPAAFSGRLQFWIPIFSAKKEHTYISSFTFFAFFLRPWCSSSKWALQMFRHSWNALHHLLFYLREAAATSRIYFPGRNTSPESLIVAPLGYVLPGFTIRLAFAAYLWWVTQILYIHRLLLFLLN